MSEFKTADEAIEAVDGTVNIDVTEWDDGFTWVITVTTDKLSTDGSFKQYEFRWDEWNNEKAETSFTGAVIAACEVAIDEMKALT